MLQRYPLKCFFFTPGQVFEDSEQRDLYNFISGVRVLSAQFKEEMNSERATKTRLFQSLKPVLDTIRFPFRRKQNQSFIVCNACPHSTPHDNFVLLEPQVPIDSRTDR